MAIAGGSPKPRCVDCFPRRFPLLSFETTSFGNVLSSVAFLYGPAPNEVTEPELDVVNPFPVVYGIRASSQLVTLASEIELRPRVGQERWRRAMPTPSWDNERAVLLTFMDPADWPSGTV